MLKIASLLHPATRRHVTHVKSLVINRSNAPEEQELLQLVDSSATIAVVIFIVFFYLCILSAGFGHVAQQCPSVGGGASTVSPPPRAAAGR